MRTPLVGHAQETPRWQRLGKVLGAMAPVAGMVPGMGGLGSAGSVMVSQST